MYFMLDISLNSTLYSIYTYTDNTCTLRSRKYVIIFKRFNSSPGPGSGSPLLFGIFSRTPGIEGFNTGPDHVICHLDHPPSSRPPANPHCTLPNWWSILRPVFADMYSYRMHLTYVKDSSAANVQGMCSAYDSRVCSVFGRPVRFTFTYCWVLKLLVVTSRQTTECCGSVYPLAQRCERIGVCPSPTHGHSSLSSSICTSYAPGGRPRVGRVSAPYVPCT